MENFKLFHKAAQTFYYIGDQGTIKAFKVATMEITTVKQMMGTSGYLQIIVIQDGKAKNHRTHRLVADYFCRKRKGPGKYLEVNHINGIKTDNRAVNLEWVTRAENTKKAYDLGLIIRPRLYFEDNPNSKYTKEQYELAYKYNMEGDTMSVAAAKAGISYGAYENYKYTKRDR